MARGRRQRGLGVGNQSVGGTRLGRLVVGVALKSGLFGIVFFLGGLGDVWCNVRVGFGKFGCFWVDFWCNVRVFVGDF